MLTDNTKLQINNWGIPEPEKGLILNPKQIDVVFIPLLIFDKKGIEWDMGKVIMTSF